MTSVVLLVFAMLGASLAIRVRLHKRDDIFIARDHGDDGIGTDFEYNAKLVGMVAIDEKRNLIYTADSDQITVLRITPIKTLEVIHSHKFPDNLFKMVQVCKGYVTVSASDLTNRENGRILVFLPFNRWRGDMMDHLIHSIPVGPDPMNHVHYHKCRKTIVAVEGRGDEFDGSVVIIDFMGKRFRNPRVKRLTFEAFESQLTFLETQWFLRDPGIDFTKQLEPEAICINEKETTAFVILQENNAVAQVSLKYRQERIVGLFGLGIKSWAFGEGTTGFDGTKDPQEENIANYPVFSAYTPSKISCITIKKQDCVFYANEGAFFGGTTTAAGDANLVNELPDALRDLSIRNENTIADPDGDDVIDIAVTTGARSFTLRCGSTAVTADTNSDLEIRMSNLGLLFNSEPSRDETLVDGFDCRSIFDGPAPQSVETFRACNGRYIVMIGGSKNPGTISVYTIDAKHPEKGFEFQDIVHGYKDTSGTLTDEELYDAGLLTLRDPRGLRITSGKKTRGRRMLITGSRISSSVELFDISVQCKAFNQHDPLHIDLPEDPIDK